MRSMHKQIRQSYFRVHYEMQLHSPGRSLLSDVTNAYGTMLGHAFLPHFSLRVTLTGLRLLFFSPVANEGCDKFIVRTYISTCMFVAMYKEGKKYYGFFNKNY